MISIPPSQWHNDNDGENNKKYIKESKHEDGISDVVKWLKKAWCQVVTDQKKIAMILSTMTENRNKHINGDDWEWLNNLQQDYSQVTIDEANKLLKQYQIWNNVEDVLYDFYWLYRSHSNEITNHISHENKLKIKWQLKFFIENLCFSIKQSKHQIPDNLVNIKMILSEKYLQQISLGSISNEVSLARDAINTMQDMKNINYMLQQKYSVLYNNFITSVWKINEMWKISYVLDHINQNRYMYSAETKQKINSIFINVRDLWLWYMTDPVLYVNYYIKNLISYYNDLVELVIV